MLAGIQAFWTTAFTSGSAQQWSPNWKNVSPLQPEECLPVPQTRAWQEPGLKHESFLLPPSHSPPALCPWQHQGALRNRILSFHAHSGLKIAAGAVVRAAGPICPDQADEQEPGSLTARERALLHIYTCKTLTYSPGSTGTAMINAALCSLYLIWLPKQLNLL